MSYGAVVVYFRLGERIHDTIASLTAQTMPPQRIVIVDNASGDGVLDNDDARYPSCTVLRMPENCGYGAAMNAGAAELAGQFDKLLFLTHEVLMESDCVARLAFAVQDQADVAMVGPALRLSRNDSTWSLGGMVTRFGDVRHNLDKDAIRQIQWLDGACLFISTAAFMDSGGFDEDYFLYWEDVDISLRLGQFSRICCVPDAIAYQETATAPPYLRTRNQILCWRKHRARKRVLAAVLIALAKAIAVDLASRSPRQAGARLLGVVDGFSGRLTSAPIRTLRERTR